jgi:hypothetical protein
MLRKLIGGDFDDNAIVQEWLVTNVLMSFSEWKDTIVGKANLRLQGKLRNLGENCLNIAGCVQKAVAKEENSEKKWRLMWTIT